MNSIGQQTAIIIIDPFSCEQLVIGYCVHERLRVFFFFAPIIRLTTKLK